MTELGTIRSIAQNVGENYERIILLCLREMINQIENKKIAW